MLDVQAELHDHGQPYHELYEAVGEMKRRHDLHPCSVRPHDSLSLRTDGERERVQDLVSRFRRLPEDTRRRLPALLNSLAQLEVVIGDLEAGLDDFQEVARIVTDPISRAEAHHNVYRAAVERRDWPTALADLRRAVALDAETFQPFPFSRYEPKEILGAGGFGVSFLCRDHEADREVVVRSLRTDALDRDVEALFRDFRTVQELDHAALVRIHDMGKAGPNESLPYLVVEHFPGQPLGEFIAQNGALSPEDWMEIGWPLGRALQALHNRGVLHRSLRPGCVLVRRTKTTDGRNRLQIKVLDAALSLKRAAVHASACNPDTHVHTSLGRSVARGLGFAPPEVVGRPKGAVWVGPHSDLYSFARLCAAGLTGRPDPDSADRLLLPEAWRKMLDECLSWTIKDRPTHAGPVLDALAKLPDSDKLIARIERDLYEEAVAELTALLEKDPEDVALLVNRGNAYYKQGEFAKAVVDFTAALDLGHEDAVGLYRRRAQSHVRLQDPAKAAEDYSEVLSREPRDLDALVNRGQAYAQTGDHDKAIADYTEGLRLSPRDEALYFNRGNAYYSKGEYDRALHDYHEALRVNPRHLWALGNRGKVYALRGERGKALTDFNRLLQLDPNNFKGRCDRAAMLLELGHVERAIEDFGEAIRLDRSPALFHDRGMARLRAGDAAGAAADLGEALAMAPGNASLLLARARALAANDQTDDALADLDDAVEAVPDSAAARTQRAELYGRLGRHQEAVEDLTEAVRLAPEATNALFARGLELAQMGEYDRSVADFSAVIRLDAESVPAWSNRGTSHQRLGDLESAVEDYGRALAIDPTDAITLLNRAGLLARMGRVEEALADYGEAVRSDPTSAQAHASRGLLLLSRGDADAALSDLDAAIRLRPKDPRPFNHRGHLLAGRGQRERAAADFEEAVRLDPAYAQAWFNLARTRCEGGEHDEAVAAYNKVLSLTPKDAGALTGRGSSRLALGDEEGALTDFAEALASDPVCVLALRRRSALLARRGDAGRALRDLDELLRLEPGDVSAYVSRGRVHEAKGDYAAAVADNEAALALSPDDAYVTNNVAWLRATVPDESLRDAGRAVELARAAVAAGEDATRLDTLAAALASAGEFAEAAKAQMKAFELAAAGQKDDFLTRLVLYRAGKPFVQERPTS